MLQCNLSKYRVKPCQGWVTRYSRILDNLMRRVILHLLVVVFSSPALFAETELSASAVNIMENWSPAGKEVILNEPIVREISIEVLDAHGKDIPDIKFSAQDGLEVERSIAVTANIKKFKFTFLPKKNGLMVLEDVEVKWKNINTSKTESTVIAGRVLFVSPEKSAAKKAQQAVVNREPPPMTWGELIMYPDSPAFPFNFLIILGLFSWILPGIYFQLVKKKKVAVKEEPPVSGTEKLQTVLDEESEEEEEEEEAPFLNNNNIKSALHTMQRGCKSGNMPLVQAVLIKWAEEIWKDDPPQTAAEIHSKLADPQLEEILTYLDSLQFAVPGMEEEEAPGCGILVSRLEKHSIRFLKTQ